ncbi:MAG: hypothetical protein GC137_06910 [Alphaproteobacteria bacterium]|nr:hypothetical protein [Alphaproteobacteria bacterium]
MLSEFERVSNVTGLRQAHGAAQLRMSIGPESGVGPFTGHNVNEQSADVAAAPVVQAGLTFGVLDT